MHFIKVSSIHIESNNVQIFIVNVHRFPLSIKCKTSPELAVYNIASITMVTINKTLIEVC